MAGFGKQTLEKRGQRIKSQYNNVISPVEDTVDDFLTFFLAGMETTANSMSFVLWYLLKHEGVYQKLQLEVLIKE